MRLVWLVFVLLTAGLASPLIEPNSAQSAFAAVELTCTAPYSSGSVEIEVYPGATLTGYADCTVSNPSVHTEKIAIEVTSDGLATASPNSIYLAAGAESDFQVTIRADSQMDMQSKSLTITASVQETSGLPPPNLAESSVNMIASILQYAGMNLEMTEPVVRLEVGSQGSIEYKIYNLGNALDNFLISTKEDPVNGLKVISLPFAGIEIDNNGPPAIIRIAVSAPTDGSDWPVDSNGLHTMTLDVEVTVQSEFSCTHTTDCKSMTLMQKVIFFQNQTVQDEPDSDGLSSSTEEQMLIYGGSAVALILLAALFLSMRRKM